MEDNILAAVAKFAETHQNNEPPVGIRLQVGGQFITGTLTGSYQFQSHLKELVQQASHAGEGAGALFQLGSNLDSYHEDTNRPDYLHLRDVTVFEPMRGETSVGLQYLRVCLGAVGAWTLGPIPARQPGK